MLIEVIMKRSRKAARKIALRSLKVRQTGRGKTRDKIANVIGNVTDAATIPLALVGGPVGLAIGVVAEVGKRVVQKAIKADWKQTKKREFDKAYKAVKNPRTKKKRNWWTGGFYTKRKNPVKNRYSEDYNMLWW